jgi:hypothetical protein
LLAGRGDVVVCVDQVEMNDSARCWFPRLETKRIGIHTLSNLAPCTETKFAAATCALKAVKLPKALEPAACRRSFGCKACELESAHLVSRELRLDCESRAQRHRKKLADARWPSFEAVHPRLKWTDDVVLRRRVKGRRPRSAGEGVNVPDADFDRARFR